MSTALNDEKATSINRSQAAHPAPFTDTSTQHLNETQAVPTASSSSTYKHRAPALAAAIFGYFLFAYDNTVIANIRPNIVEDLGSIEDLPLLSVAYNVGTLPVNLLWGQLYRSFNAKWLFCGAIFVFEVGTAVCGAAPSMGALIAGRVIAGLGGGGIYLGTMTFVTTMTTEAERPKWLAFVGISYAGGLICGPIIGGAFASHATWRWSFYLLLPIGAILAPCYLFLLPSLATTKTTSLASRLKDIDYLGFLLFAALIAGFDLFPTLGGSEYAWSSSIIIGLAVCFAGGFVLFAAQQYLCLLTTRTARLFPGHLLLSWEMCLQWGGTCLVMFSTYVPLYTMPLQLQFVFGDSALGSGVKLLPYIGVLAVSILASGGLMRKHPFYMAYYLLSGLLILISGILLHFATLERGYGYLLGVSVIGSAGCGLCAQTGFTVAQAKTARSENMAATTSFIGLAQVGGISIGLVASVSLFINLAAKRLRPVFPEASRRAVVNAVSGVDSSLLNAASPEVRLDAVKHVQSAVQDVYWLVVASGAALVLLALCMKRERLSVGGVAGQEHSHEDEPGEAAREIVEKGGS